MFNTAELPSGPIQIMRSNSVIIVIVSPRLRYNKLTAFPCVQAILSTISPADIGYVGLHKI